ncbi:LADA_0A04808g1_1 [Lachancea dasiensis]|uniref:LADA_0A04808g1_1 n=1 Tax=Lachancea dasiensis TaxID=1072105 RepID=A0A1G4INN7_9SACH|nr:LADA_0A04808g1_1 [Lachancea dasiensis]
MGVQHLDLQTLYSLSHEYSDSARKLAVCIATDSQVRQYQILIYHAIRALQMIKDTVQLSAEQDVMVTLELCELLVQETHELDLVETYLSSALERLYGTGLVQQKMVVIAALVRVARARKSAKHTKNALRLVAAALEDVKSTGSRWDLYFQYLRVELIIEVSPSDSRIPALFGTLISSSRSVPGFEAFVICAYIGWSLQQHHKIVQEYLDRLGELSSACLPVQLKLWNNLTELLVLIYRDANITSKLSDFKALVAAHKNEAVDSTFQLSLDEEVVLSLDSPTFRYKDFKHIILLFQSISYLTNCYDKKANFSVKYLPKVKKAASELLLSCAEGGGLEQRAYRRAFYKTIVDLCNYYMGLESLILKGDCSELVGENDYVTLIRSMRAQIGRNSVSSLEGYSSLQQSKNPEFQLIGLCGAFAIEAAVMSRTGGTIPFQKYEDVNKIWSKIEKLFAIHSFDENHIWQSTKTVLWICAHFQPFTSSELSKDNDIGYLDILKSYFAANSFVNGIASSSKKIDSTKKSPVLKKSLLLHLLLNYLSGAIIVHDLEEKCVISNTCYHVASQQHMPLMEYISGLSHLINCGLAMKNKDVSIVKKKLNDTVQSLLSTGFERAQ